MTPQQQTALETLVDRPLTDDEIVQAEARNDALLAASLSVGRTRIQSREIGTGTILAVLAPNGGEFIDALVALGETDRNVYWSMELIKQGRFDIGMPKAREQIQALATGNPDLAPSVAALLAYGEVPDPLPVAAVSAILNGDAP